MTSISILYSYIEEERAASSTFGEGPVLVMTLGDDLEYCSVCRSCCRSFFEQAERVAVEVVAIAVIGVIIVTIPVKQSVCRFPCIFTPLESSQTVVQSSPMRT